jgi:hypothetical protein
VWLGRGPPEIGCLSVLLVACECVMMIIMLWVRLSLHHVSLWCVSAFLFVVQQALGWRVRMISDSKTDEGGYKNAVLEIQGEKVYSKLKFEVSQNPFPLIPILNPLVLY